MHRALIVARIAPDAAGRVAEIFAESDRTDLPGVVGVRHRSLYQLGDLYLHLLETVDPASVAVGRGADHPEFARVSQRLRPYISPYLPTWRSPRDAMAECFYHWDAPTAPTARAPADRSGPATGSVGLAGTLADPASPVGSGPAAPGAPTGSQPTGSTS